jgi:hypothetical protein
MIQDDIEFLKWIAKSTEEQQEEVQAKLDRIDAKIKMLEKHKKDVICRINEDIKSEKKLKEGLIDYWSNWVERTLE